MKTKRGAIVRGVVAGLVAGVPQVLLVQIAEKPLGLPSDQADIGPRFVERAAERLGQPLDPPAHWALATIFHFAYAAGWGALYGLADRLVRPPPLVAAPVLAAIIYVLAFSPIGAGTQTEAVPPPHRRDWRDDALHWIAALSFSATTALTCRWLERRADTERRPAGPTRPPAAAGPAGPPLTRRYDAVVVGAGPNGLAAAIELARAGRSVVVFEGATEAGGGARTEALTLPGFRHDVCSAVHPLGVGSPLFRTLPLGRYGLAWIHSPAVLAHPTEDGRAILLERSVAATAGLLGTDGPVWRALVSPFVARWRALFADALGPLHLPRHPLLLAAFGALALVPTTALIGRAFRTEPARALFAGIAAHATAPLDRPPSAAFGLILGVAGHAVGWPIPRGGSGQIAAALVAHLRALGGDLVTGRPIASLAELPSAAAVLLDLTAAQLLRLGGIDLPPRYRRQLAAFEPGLATFKVDWALDGPIPWRAPECARAATVHLGTSDEIVAGRRAEWAGRPADPPFVLLAQPSLFDPTRAPPGKHTAWAYCHLPRGSTVDMAARIEAQVERFAPGFGARILARHCMDPADLERHNPNMVGGDINGGESTLRQLFFRPAVRLNPYTTPVAGVYLCSASTPPGGAVHGMCGFHAARTVLRGRLAVLAPPLALGRRPEVGP